MPQLHFDAASLGSSETTYDFQRDGTKALATEMGPDTRVNCIAPGFVPTHFADYIVKNEAIKAAIEERTLLNRLGTTHDMAAVAAFLASDDAAYITGETLVVAGGMPSRL